MPDFIIIGIEDNGLGISEIHQSKMFSMFKRFHHHVEGTGIGLYIVKRIVENAGGKIEVESEENKGTRFKVYLRNEMPEKK
jgi:signal transduction histidine kinase